MGERNIDRLPLLRPLLGTEPATQARALIRNQTSALLVLQDDAQPTEPHGSGQEGHFVKGIMNVGRCGVCPHLSLAAPVFCGPWDIDAASSPGPAPSPRFQRLSSLMPALRSPLSPELSSWVTSQPLARR